MRIIRNPGAVYRSTSPDHLAIVRRNQADREAAQAEAERVCAQLVPGSEPYGVVYDTGAFGVSGCLVTDHGIAELPEGMRWDTKARKGARVLVPRMKTPEGKAIGKRLDDLGFVPKSLGAVSKVVCISDGRNRWFASGVIEVIGEQVFATYLHPIDDRRFSDKRPNDREQVESDPYWEPVPLSEFYAARESTTPADVAGESEES